MPRARARDGAHPGVESERNPGRRRTSGSETDSVVRSRRSGAPPQSEPFGESHHAGQDLGPGGPEHGCPPRSARRAAEARRGRLRLGDRGPGQRDHDRRSRGRGREGRAAVRGAHHAARTRPRAERVVGRPLDRADQGRGGDADPGARRRVPHRPRTGHRPQDPRTEAVRGRDAQRDRHVRDRSRRHGQDLPRGGDRRPRARAEAGLAPDPHAAGRRGGRAPRVPAGDAVREDRPVHEAAVRRPVRDDGRRRAGPAHGTRDRRGGARSRSCGEGR